jgi:hypothetical protein
MGHIWSTYHRWSQLCHLLSLILKPQGWISTPLPSNHPTQCESIVGCILFSQYLILNIAHTLTSIFHTLFILKVISIMCTIYLFSKNYINLNFFLNFMFQWWFIGKTSSSTWKYLTVNFLFISHIFIPHFIKKKSYNVNIIYHILINWHIISVNG